LRYAIYFAPASDDPLTAEASRWLGRNAFTGETFPTSDVAGISPDEVHTLTADPRRYAFHATLKAPFELAEGYREADLIDAFKRFAATTPAFDIPNVVIGQLGRFFALVPDRIYPDLQAFAANIVEEFEPFRAPLSDADIARRKPDTLPPAHRANLMRWGYPHVMDEFRFHMTLTGPVPEAQCEAMDAVLRVRFADFIGRPLMVDTVCLFVEPVSPGDFVVDTAIPLAGSQD
jgi:putative phosphonate metabolism protein